jgi:hypothetical protein
MRFPTTYVTFAFLLLINAITGSVAHAQINIPMAGTFQFVNPDIATLNGVHEDGGIITGTFLYDPNTDRTRVVDFVLDEEFGPEGGGADLGPTSQLSNVSIIRPMFDGSELTGHFQLFSNFERSSFQYSGDFGPGPTGTLTLQMEFGTQQQNTIVVQDSGPIDYTIIPIVPTPEPSGAVLYLSTVPLLRRRRA